MPSLLEEEMTITQTCNLFSDHLFFLSIIMAIKQHSLHAKTYLLYFIRIKHEHKVFPTWKSTYLHYVPILFVKNSVVRIFYNAA